MIPQWYDHKNFFGYNYYDLYYYVWKLATGQYFARPFWGDAEVRIAIMQEFNLMEIQDAYENNSVEIIKNAMIKGISFAKKNENFMLSIMDKRFAHDLYDIQRFNCQIDNKNGQAFFIFLEEQNMKNYKWHNGSLFFMYTWIGMLNSIIQQLNKMHVCIVAPEQDMVIKEYGFNYNHFIPVIREKSHGIKQIPYIMENIKEYAKLKGDEGIVYIICCGEASTVCITDLYELFPNNWFIDFGCSLDTLAGYMYYGHDKPNEKDPELFKKKQQLFYKRIRSNFKTCSHFLSELDQIS